MSVAKITFRERLPGPEGQEQPNGNVVFKRIFRILASSFCPICVNIFCLGGPKLSFGGRQSFRHVCSQSYLSTKAPRPRSQDDEFAAKWKRFWTPLFSNVFSDHLQAVYAEMMAIFFVQVDLNFRLVGGRAAGNVCNQSYLRQRLPGPEGQDNEFATKWKRFWTPLFSNTFSDHLQAVSAEMVSIFFVRVDLNFRLVAGKASGNVYSQSYVSTKAPRPKGQDNEFATKWNVFEPPCFQTHFQIICKQFLPK